MSDMTSTKPYSIAKSAVREAYRKVKANRGSAGIDDETIAKFERHLSRKGGCGECCFYEDGVLLIGAADQVEQFLAQKLVVAGEIGNHPHDGFGKIGRPLRARGEEGGISGNSLHCCQGLRLAVGDGGGQLGIERDHPASRSEER